MNPYFIEPIIKLESDLLKVQQVSCFYNYAIGLNVTHVDLLETSAALLKSGIVRTVCFSDLKAVYLDKQDNIQFEWLRPQGGQWDNSWEVKLSESLPKNTIEDLVFCLNLSFHERRIEGQEARQMSPYLRAALPPIVLESDDVALPVYPWLKIHADGLMLISFQLDMTWSNLKEEDFICDIVNLFQRYFKYVWVQANLQRIDGELILSDAFQNVVSIDGQSVSGRLSNKLIKKMRREARDTLNASLNKEGQCFNLHGASWLLHPLAGSESEAEWKGTIDLCRSIYANAVASHIVSKSHGKSDRGVGIQLWQGRPSISLIRFADQPQSKEHLFVRYGQSMSRILSRSAGMKNPPQLPTDLRLFPDYCLHGNRSILLWTWLMQNDAPDDAWEDPNTMTALLENEARAEHFEYHNIRISRACAMAGAPASDEHLMYAYETLANAENIIHHSSQAGEITDAIKSLLNSTGTMALIASGKEQARWHLDQRRYNAEKRRSNVDRWLAIVFGIVGVAGMADLIFRPLLQTIYPDWAEWITGTAAFMLALFALVLLGGFIGVINKK